MSSVPDVRLVDAAEDLHQGRLAGPVLADERVSLAGVQIKRYVLERVHAGKRLRGAAERENVGVRSVRRPSRRVLRQRLRSLAPACGVRGRGGHGVQMSGTDGLPHTQQPIGDPSGVV